MALKLSPPSEDLLFKNSKTGDPRWGEQVALPTGGASFTGLPGTVLCGYPDDEGISLNRGRPGAAKAPDVIRRHFYRTSANPSQSQKTLYDIGNAIKESSLSHLHEDIRNAASTALSAGHQWIGIGGGHDFGYSDGAGFLDYCLQLKKEKPKLKKPLILNFDAHLDVRPMDKGPSSGTPFFRLLNDKSFMDFDIVQLGVQRHCNSEKHAQWFESKGGKIIWWEDIMISGFTPHQYVLDFLANEYFGSRPTYLSIDIDGFSNAYAMGCSQSWSTGWEPSSFFPVFQALLGQHDVRALGIYEVSPPLDQDDRTCKLAAQIIHHFLHSDPRND